MKATKRVSAAAMVGIVWAATACGPKEDAPSANEDIVRLEVPNSPFKPVDLEESIENLVAAFRGSEVEPLEITVITKATSNFWTPVNVGVERAMEELKLTGQVEAALDADDPELSVNLQIELLRKRIDEGYDAIGLAPLNELLDPAIDEAVDAGIPVVTIDSDAPNTKRQLYIGTNNGEAGKTAAGTLIGLLPESEGTVVILGSEYEGWADGYARTMAAREAIEAAGYTAVVHHVGWTSDEIAEDFTVLPTLVEQADPPVVGMMGMFANAYRCAEIAEQLGMNPGDVKIVAFDSEPDTLLYMDQGYIQATHVQRQYYMGYLVPYALTSIKRLGLSRTAELLGDRMLDEHRFDTGVDVVGADQIEDYYNFLDALGIH